MKQISLPVAVFIGIVGCVLAVSASVRTGQISDTLKKERFVRLQAEEQLLKARAQIEVLLKEVNDSRSKMSEIQNILTQGKSTNQKLQEEMDQMAQEKEALQNKLMELQGSGAGAGTPESANP